MSKLDCGTQHLDFKGQVICLGHKVIFTRGRQKEKLAYGEVVKITPKMVTIKYTYEWINSSTGFVVVNSYNTAEYPIDVMVDDIEVERQKKLEMI